MVEAVDMTELNLHTRTKILAIYLNEDETMFLYDKTSGALRAGVWRKKIG